MRSLFAALLVVTLSGGTRAQVMDPEGDMPPPTAPAAKKEPAKRPARARGPDPFEGKTAPEALAALRALEARLSLGQTTTPAEIELMVKASADSPHAPVRALAVAVLAWLDPSTAAGALLAAYDDEDPRVRAAAAASLLSLARRFDDEQRRRVVSRTLSALDDEADEVACSSVELLGALSPSAAADAVRSRADDVGDVRHACFSRVGGLPVRAIELPPLPDPEPAPDDGKQEPDGKEPAPTPPPTPPKKAPDGTWLAVATAATAGFVGGGLLPSGAIPSRDVLLYDDDSSQITREEVAPFTQLGTGLLGAAALGGGAWALSTWVRPLDVEDAAAVAIATGALGFAGASAPLAFGLREGPGAITTASGLLLGTVGGMGLAYGFELDVNDEVLAASAMMLGGLASGLGAFTATPVGLQRVGDAFRVDFGMGIIGMGAGVSAFGALAAGAVVDVRPARSFAVLAGGLIGGGLFTTGAFLVVPDSDVKSRIACGVGLAGELAGIAAGAFIPDTWLPVPPLGPPKPTTTPSASAGSGGRVASLDDVE